MKTKALVRLPQWVFVVPRMNFAAGMALFPFILVAEESLKRDKILINHETIHLQQQLELFILPFYVLYLGNYFFNLLRYQSHWKAYQNICFEREAYQNEGDLDYLPHRNLWTFLKYL